MNNTPNNTPNLTKLIQSEYLECRVRMEEQYNTIMKEIVHTQLSDKDIIEMTMNEINNHKSALNKKSDMSGKNENEKIMNIVASNNNVFKKKQFELTFKLKLGALFDTDNEYWLYYNDNIVKFGKGFDIKYTRFYDKASSMYEEWFKNDKYIRDVFNRLKVLFPGANVSPGICLWYESSNQLEYGFRVSVPFPVSE